MDYISLDGYVNTGFICANVFVDAGFIGAEGCVSDGCMCCL